MENSHSISTGNIKIDIFMSVSAVMLATVGNSNVDMWLQRLAWTGAIVVSIATILKIVFIDFKRKK